jgi:hypothetical protein
VKLVVNARRPGHASVRGGRLLRVLAEHAVPRGGGDVRGKRPGETPRARPRDLALEILAKNWIVLGHSYLSGPAIGMNRYTPAGPGWFEPEPAVLARASFSSPTDAELGDKAAMDAFYLRETEAAMAIKYGGADAAVFRGRAEGGGAMPDVDFAKRILHHALTTWSYAPKDDESGKGAHLFAVVRVGKKADAVGHWQPREHASESTVTGFQHDLVWDAWQRAAEAKEAAGAPQE